MQAFCLLGVGWGRGGGKKGAVHANRVFCGRRARCLHKEPADGSRWPTVTPEEMHPYNNDILPHKAPCVLVATHGHMSERRPSISSPSVALTLSAPVAHSLYCVAFHHRALSLRSLPVAFFSRRFRIRLRRGHLKTCHHRAGIPVAHLPGNWRRRPGDSRRRTLVDRRMSRPSWKKLARGSDVVRGRGAL